jgi:hypothetical protein
MHCLTIAAKLGKRNGFLSWLLTPTVMICQASRLPIQHVGDNAIADRKLSKSPHTAYAECRTTPIENLCIPMSQELRHVHRLSHTVALSGMLVLRTQPAFWAPAAFIYIAHQTLPSPLALYLLNPSRLSETVRRHTEIAPRYTAPGDVSGDQDRG